MNMGSEMCGNEVSREKNDWTRELLRIGAGGRTGRQAAASARDAYDM
jgi:hypothetical protein